VGREVAKTGGRAGLCPWLLGDEEVCKRMGLGRVVLTSEGVARCVS
jgi:hypothetical protein